MSRPSSPILLIPFTLLLLITSFAGRLARADPAVVPFRHCSDDSGENAENKFVISTIYAQVLRDAEEQHYLNLTVLGTSPSEIVGLTNQSTSLATLFTSTSVLTLNAWTNASYLCQNLRPPSPLPPVEEGVLTYCPIPAGEFAFSSTIPWGNNRELTTLNTRLRAVDPFGQELVCLDVATTPLASTQHSIYGKANIILWSTVGLTLVYWVVVGIARITSAWNRGITRHHGKGVWSRAQSAGFILASAISGERLASSPALLRFCTPSLRDVIFHTQWCAILGMVAVEWPQFIYPLLTQTAWATLAFNVTLTDDTREHRWHPLTTPPFEPPSSFADQIADAQSPLYIDPTVPNTLFTLPSDSTRGISSFAYTLGVRPQDLFSVCLIIFLGIIAGTIVASTILWFIDVVVTNLVMKFNGQNPSYSAANPRTRLGGARSPGVGGHSADPAPGNSLDESKPLTANGFGLSRFPSGPLGGLTSSLSGEREQRDRGFTPRLWSWLRFRSDIGSFHGNVLHGNLVRILVWFHLPVTVFSCYQMTLPRSIASTTSITLAALSFVVFSIIIPAHLVIRVTFTTTNKLYDETRTLLSFGPLYNHYRHGSQLFASLFFATNIAFGVTIGAGQKSGTAQAIVILVVEVISALVTSIWLPWGSGASMGLISFLFCVARIVIAVLLVILTPTISIGPGPAGWISYGILIILALVYLALVLMLVVKLVEAAVRIGGGLGFDQSRSAVDAGLIGALGALGCCGSRKKNARRGKNRAKSTTSKSNVYKSTEAGGTPISGSGMFSPRRNSDLSSYNPPAALLSNESDRGSTTAPKFLGSADSRKGSTHSHPPSFLRPEHANQPYREETDQDWWMENENQGGAFIMGAWQPYSDPSRHPPQMQQQPHRPLNAGSSASSSPAPSPPTSGFSRVGGGRAHIDNPYAIMQNPNATQQMAVPNTNTANTFPSIGQQGSAILTAPPLLSTPSNQTHHQPQPPPHRPSPSRNHPPSAFQNYQNPNSPAGAFINDEDEPPLPLSIVRQAQPVNAAIASTSVQPQHHLGVVDMGDLPPGAMQPAHVRTKSQTAIVEDAGALLYAANQGGAGGSNPGGRRGSMSARLSLPGSALPPLKISAHRNTSSSSSGGQQQPPSAPARFMLGGGGDEDDDADSLVEDQQQKKKWYQFGKKRPHSSEGRTSNSSAAVGGAMTSSPPLQSGGGDLKEFGRVDASDGPTPQPQRSFVVIRKPAGSMGRLNQGTAAAAAAASSSADQQRSATSPRSRPPTR